MAVRGDFFREWDQRSDQSLFPEAYPGRAGAGGNPNLAPAGAMAGDAESPAIQEVAGDEPGLVTGVRRSDGLHGVVPEIRNDDVGEDDPDCQFCFLPGRLDEPVVWAADG